MVRILIFSSLYFLVNIFLVPIFAKWESGRVPLPVFGNPVLKPHQIGYFAALNHHYVRPEVKASCERVAAQLAKQFPGTCLYYLDANFPFFDGYPLQPHYTHRNGITVDIALHWKNKTDGKPLDGAPFPLAYGVSAKPLPGEVDMEDKCKNKYRSIEMRLTEKLVDVSKYELDEKITGEMIRLFLKEKSVCKILLEPHLKTRLGLEKEDKLRFQGCHAARHDDHIHVIWCN
ncbi:MAG: hypothetical protein IT258_00920 [Saprospiraceae bacterium]|nr:hypothetical protein [Saprospiraceae bacterium]